MSSGYIPYEFAGTLREAMLTEAELAEISCLVMSANWGSMTTAARLKLIAAARAYLSAGVHEGCVTTLEEGEIIVWNNPLCTKLGFVATCVSRATKAAIITAQKGNFPERNYTDKQALEDFMVVHWAWFEPNAEASCDHRWEHIPNDAELCPRCWAIRIKGTVVGSGSRRAALNCEPSGGPSGELVNGLKPAPPQSDLVARLRINRYDITASLNAERKEAATAIEQRDREIESLHREWTITSDEYQAAKAEIERLREALQLSVPVMEREREIIVRSYTIVYTEHPNVGELTDDGKALVVPIDAAITAASAALAHRGDGE